MKTLIILVFVVLFFPKCAYIDKPSVESPEYETPLPVTSFKVNITPLNYTKEQKEKLAKAEKILVAIFNSSKFRDEIVSREFTNNKGLTSLEIYEKLMRGSEILNPEANETMDLQVKMYNSPLSKAVGYTYPDILVVFTNLKFHKNYTPCRVASNLCHEASHKWGFDHSSSKDSKSVPYSLNQIVEKLCQEILE